MEKKIVIAKINGNQRVDLEIEFTKGRLSICGNHWNHLKTDIYSGGQIQDTLRQWLQGESIPGKIRWLIGKDRLTKILDMWDRWHMNDMRAACEHQRELGWTWATHPCVPCPVCGYKLGTEWKREEVPQDVIDFLFPEWANGGRERGITQL